MIGDADVNIEHASSPWQDQQLRDRGFTLAKFKQTLRHVRGNAPKHDREEHKGVRNETGGKEERARFIRVNELENVGTKRIGRTLFQ